MIPPLCQCTHSLLAAVALVRTRILRPAAQMQPKRVTRCLGSLVVLLMVLFKSIAVWTWKLPVPVEIESSRASCDVAAYTRACIAVTLLLLVLVVSDHTYLSASMRVKKK